MQRDMELILKILLKIDYMRVDISMIVKLDMGAMEYIHLVLEGLLGMAMSFWIKFEKIPFGIRQRILLKRKDYHLSLM